MKRVPKVVTRAAKYVSWGVLGFLIGSVTIYVLMLRAGPELQPWHLVELDGEFTAEREAEVDSLDAYRELEDKLFAELRERVYRETPSGAAYELVRFSEGSAADPETQPTDWNRSFELIPKQARGGVLLLHGMSDSPYSLRALGQALHGRGYRVVGLRIPGHGSAPSGLLEIDWHDMAAAVRVAMRHLGAELGAKPLHVIGYSNGAALALDYALETETHGTPAPQTLVLISPAIGITPFAALARVQLVLAEIPGLDKLAWNSVQPEFDPFRYNSFTTNAGSQVFLITGSVTQRIETRAGQVGLESFPRTVVFLSTVDATVSTDAVVDNLLEHLQPDGHELVLFDINRRAVAKSLMVADPGPLTARMMAARDQPFELSLITNQTTAGLEVVIRHKPALSSDVTTTPLGIEWPRFMFSLSHVALPFSPDDPLYGARRPTGEDGLFLGSMGLRGERGVLLIPADSLLRLRHNPFYAYLENRTLDWIDAGGPTPGLE